MSVPQEQAAETGLVESREVPEDIDSDIILRVENLVKYFEIRSGVLNRIIGYVHAVDGVSFEVKRGSTLGIVGESGCGKTTLGKVILRLIEPTDGKVYFNGVDIFSVSRRAFRKQYRKKMQVVFQDPYASLNPRMMIKDALSEPIIAHRIMSRKEILPYLVRVLREVGLDKEHLMRYPHEFSGGQRQRICIARALVLNPELIVLDEPTASLDVSVQARVLNLLKRLQKRRGLTYLFISHDLSTVTHMSDTVMVMYLGRIMEIGPKEIFTMEESKIHPYTAALASAIPIPDPDYEKPRIILKGDVPSPVNPPSGCVFHTRCPYTQPNCETEVPELKKIGENHYVACHYR